MKPQIQARALHIAIIALLLLGIVFLSVGYNIAQTQGMTSCLLKVPGFIELKETYGFSNVNVRMCFEDAVGFDPAADANSSITFASLCTQGKNFAWYTRPSLIRTRRLPIAARRDANAQGGVYVAGESDHRQHDRRRAAPVHHASAPHRALLALCPPAIRTALPQCRQKLRQSSSHQSRVLTPPPQARHRRPILHRRQHFFQRAGVCKCVANCSAAQRLPSLYVLTLPPTGWFLVRLSTRFDSVNCVLLPLSTLLILLCGISSGVCLRAAQIRYETIDIPPSFPTVKKEGLFLPGSILIIFGSVLHVLILAGAFRLKQIQKWPPPLPIFFAHSIFSHCINPLPPPPVLLFCSASSWRSSTARPTTTLTTTKLSSCPAIGSHEQHPEVPLAASHSHAGLSVRVDVTRRKPR